MSAVPQRNLHIFEELIGSRSAESVTLATTMWDKLSRFDNGDERENGLKEEYWKGMIDHGAAVERFLNTSDSAWSIVDNIVNKNNHKAALLFQEERVDEKKPFKKTSVGEALYPDLDKLFPKRQQNRMRGPVRGSDSNGRGTHIPIKSP